MLRRVAVVDGSGGCSQAVGLVCRDLAATLGAYARLAEVEVPEVVGEGDRADAVLLVVDADEGVREVSGQPSYSSVLEEGTPSLWAPLYAIVLARDWDGAAAERALEDLRRSCEKFGRRWMGGLAVGGSALVVRTARSPRMGWPRRRLSEAADRVVIALLSGEAAGIELVRPPMPHWAWRLVEHLA